MPAKKTRLLFHFGIDISGSGGIQCKIKIFGCIIPYGKRKIHGNHPVVRDILIYDLSVLIISFSAVASEIFVCPPVRNPDVRKLFGQLFDYRMRSRPRCVKVERISVKAVAVAVPLGTPIPDRPIVPVLFAVKLSFCRTEISSVDIFRHRDDFFEVKGTDTEFFVDLLILITGNGSQDLLKAFPGAIKGQSVFYMIRHFLLLSGFEFLLPVWSQRR